MSDEEAKWYLMIAGTREGPITAQDAAARLDRGEFGLATLAYGPGFTDWIPVAEIPEIADRESPEETTGAVMTSDSAVAVQAQPPGLPQPVSLPATPATPEPPPKPEIPATMDESPMFSAPPSSVAGPAPGPAPRRSRPPASGVGMEPVRTGEEAAESTLQFTISPAAEYSRVNFILRLFGFFYMLYVAHMAMWMGYRIAAAVASTLNLILALITGGHHPGLVNYLQRFLRFEARMSMSVLGLTEEIPHIDVNARRPDFPVDLTTEPGMEIGPGAVILRLSGIIGIMLIPHMFALGLLGFVACFALLAGFLSVIFTGSWPAGVFKFLVGVMRWNLRVLEYIFGLSTKYPPFGLN